MASTLKLVILYDARNNAYTSATTTSRLKSRGSWLRNGRQSCSTRSKSISDRNTQQKIHKPAKRVDRKSNDLRASPPNLDFKGERTHERSKAN
jgi:hypothetical protein